MQTGRIDLWSEAGRCRLSFETGSICGRLGGVLPIGFLSSRVIAIVVSRADSASTHIGEHLLACEEWTPHEDPDRPDSAGGGTYYRTDGFELREFASMHLDLDDPAQAFSAPDDIAFLVSVSRHAGETGPLLTAHFTGNFGAADYGGEPASVARAAPGAQKVVVDALADHTPANYDVGIECTHHGPTTLSVPSLFVELGSDEPQWQDPEGARAVAKAVLELRGATADHRVRPDGPPRHVVGFGGGHYTPRCTRLVRNSDWAVGHIGSDWQLDTMGDPTANQALIDRVFEASNAEIAVVDGDRPILTSVIDDLGYRVVSETWLRTVGTRPLDVVDAAETLLSSVDNGLRFGEVSVSAAGAASDTDSGADTEANSLVDHWFVVDLPDELLASAAGVDGDAVWNAVATRTVAFETTEGATLPSGRALVVDAAAFDELVDRLAELLEASYESVERSADEVVCRATRFDPQKASTLGVPEGPKFGTLASGTAITINGRRIEPHAVESPVVERFAVPSPEPPAGVGNESDRCQTNGKHK